MSKRERTMTNREVATITIYPAQGQSHAPAAQLSALAAYSRALLSALPEENRRRHVVLTNFKGDAASSFDDGGIEVREVWKKGSLLFAFQILGAVRRMPGLRVVHLQHEFNQFGGAATIPFILVLLWSLRFIFRKKVLVTFHEVVGRELLDPELAKNFCLPVPPRVALVLFRWYYRAAAFAANELFIQHEKFRDLLRGEMGIRTPTQILRIGTEDPEALADREGSRKVHGYGAGDKVLLFFGTLDWRKGLDVLIDAFERLPAEDGYRLLIGGGQPVRIKGRPEYQAWYGALARRMEANPAIRQIGFVADEDVPGMFAASDLVVLPYVVPQMVSAVLNHAASYERPFICSDAFRGHADELALFPARTEELAEKIRWAFAGGCAQELLAYALRYKRENSWTRSAELLAGRYRLMMDADMLDPERKSNP
jgi:glycosyltransferase involved in cell wall biosynthesis